MSFQRAPADQQGQSDQQGGDADYYRRVLHELIDMGADLARMVHRQALAQASEPDPAAGTGRGVPDATVAFDRISRAVRRSICLARRLDEAVPASGSQLHSVQQHSIQHRAAARRRILREVEDVMQRSDREDPGGRLHLELLERLDGPELDDEIDDRPVAEIIADICRDLGLTTLPGSRPWKRRTPEDVAVLCARAAVAAPVPFRPAARAGRDPPA